MADKAMIVRATDRIEGNGQRATWLNTLGLASIVDHRLVILNRWFLSAHWVVENGTIETQDRYIPRTIRVKSSYGRYRAQLDHLR